MLATTWICRWCRYENRGAGSCGNCKRSMAVEVPYESVAAMWATLDLNDPKVVERLITSSHQWTSEMFTPMRKVMRRDAALLNTDTLSPDQRQRLERILAPPNNEANKHTAKPKRWWQRFGF